MEPADHDRHDRLERERRVEREREFHDARFAKGDGRRRSSGFYDLAQSSQERFSSWIQEIPTGSRVLELGCGPDSVAWDLWERGVEVTGIDISATAIERAREQAEERGIDPEFFHVDNAEAPNLTSDQFDVVIGSAILHHIDLGRALANIGRVLHPGGTGLFHEPLGRNPAINAYRRLTPSERSADEHPLTRQDLELIERHFGVAEFEFFHLLSLAAFPLLKTRALVPVRDRLERADRLLLDRVPGLSTFAWVVLIRVRNQKQC